MGFVVSHQRFGDLGQPVVQLRRRAGVERWHGTDDSRLTLRNHQLRVADDEQRCANDRQCGFLQGSRQMGHGNPQS